jgi:hypothetical protein
MSLWRCNAVLAMVYAVIYLIVAPPLSRSIAIFQRQISMQNSDRMLTALLDRTIGDLTCCLDREHPALSIDDIYIYKELSIGTNRSSRSFVLLSKSDLCSSAFDSHQIHPSKG